MNYGLYLSASGVLTNMHRQDAAANNLANVGTAGFRRSIAALQQRPAEAPEGAHDPELANALLDRLGGGVWVHPTQIDTSTGQLQQTGNAFDLALEGEGFFAIRQTENGQTHERLTRDGRLTVSADGFLCTASGGHKMLGASGTPIVLDIGEPFDVDQRGNVRQNNSIVDTLRVVRVPAEAIHPVGHGLYEVPASVMSKAPAADALVRQGHIEGSNVDSVQEMLDLMAATRAITANANLIRYHDSVMDRAVNVLGRVA